MLLEEYYKQFIRAGAKLGPDDQQKLRALNKQISILGVAFRQKLLAATKAGALVVDDPAKLSGLGQAGVEAAARDAKEHDLTGKYLCAPFRTPPSNRPFNR